MVVFSDIFAWLPCGEAWNPLSARGHDTLGIGRPKSRCVPSRSCLVRGRSAPPAPYARSAVEESGAFATEISAGCLPGWRSMPSSVTPRNSIRAGSFGGRRASEESSRENDRPQPVRPRGGRAACPARMNLLMAAALKQGRAGASRATLGRDLSCSAALAGRDRSNGATG